MLLLPFPQAVISYGFSSHSQCRGASAGLTTESQSVLRRTTTLRLRDGSGPGAAGPFQHRLESSWDSLLSWQKSLGIARSVAADGLEHPAAPRGERKEPQRKRSPCQEFSLLTFHEAAKASSWLEELLALGL